MWKKTFFVAVVAIMISTLGIEASDLLRGNAGRLTGTALLGQTGPCGVHETLVRFGGYALCVDTYEASPGSSCVNQQVDNEIQSNDNFYTPGCKVITAPNSKPWRYVSYTESKQLCAREGKRLPTAEEWYRLAIGITDINSCILGSESVESTGSGCTAPNGVFDLVGNVWEWTDDTVVDGQREGRYLPQSGYVSEVTADGIVTDTSDQPVRQFGEDYATINHDGERGIVRGGFYGSGSDGGIFAQNMSVPLQMAASGIGFRCVRDVE